MLKTLLLVFLVQFLTAEETPTTTEKKEEVATTTTASTTTTTTGTTSTTTTMTTTTTCHDSYTREMCKELVEEKGPGICVSDFKIRWLCCQTCEEKCKANATLCEEPKDHPCDHAAIVSPLFCEYMIKNFDVCHGDGLKRKLALVCADMCWCMDRK